MSLLKKENWIVSLILMLVTEGIYSFIIAHFLNLYDKEAWYYKWQYWVIGALCLIFPAIIMLMVFQIQITAKVATTLNVPGKEIYNNPYSWILCIIVPVLGWALFAVMILYINIWIIVSIYRGEAEKYIGA